MGVEFRPDPSSHGVEASQGAQISGASKKASESKPTSQKQTGPRSQSVSTLGQETNVIFRRDSSGQIYYVFTDANTGREIQELPPKQVRATGQGIADFVKELEERNSNRLKVKG
jgi:uncharacterized FlaG/YvyC family protein